MQPFYKLRPAYRHGKDTPWGGDGLRRHFGKDIPDDHTGEALEASTLPGLESHTEDGRTLTEIAGGPLPLLLKLIDARESLSVQVHPDDAYAAAHENGNLGKTEAWAILDAVPGARLVYGLQPGTDVAALSGQDIEARLRWLPVSAGDVFYIPAGTVHAIGGGILLYEIQQTSDVTYRFWDWDRVDAQGNRRALHWQKALDVSSDDTPCGPIRGEEERLPGGTLTRYLQTPFFSLEKLSVCGGMALPEKPGFQYLTALQPGILRHPSQTLPFSPGDTVYVPPARKDIAIQGDCSLLVSAEGAGA